MLAPGGDLATTMAPMACVGWGSACTRSQAAGVDHQNIIILGAYVTALAARFWRQALEEPALVHYPHVRMSMYSYSRWSPAHCLAPTSPEGWVNCLAGGNLELRMDAPELKGLSFPAVPTAQNVPYASPGVGSAVEQFFGVPPGGTDHSENPWWGRPSAFRALKLLVGMMKTTMLGSLPGGGGSGGGRLPERFQENATAPVVAPWVDWADCTVGHGGVLLPPTNFWQEKLVHLGLGGAAKFYFFNVWSQHQVGSKGRDETLNRPWYPTKLRADTKVAY